MQKHEKYVAISIITFLASKHKFFYIPLCMADNSSICITPLLFSLSDMKLFTLVFVFDIQAVCTEAGMFALHERKGAHNAGGLRDGGGQGDEGRIMRRTCPYGSCGSEDVHLL